MPGLIDCMQATLWSSGVARRFLHALLFLTSAASVPSASEAAPAPDAHSTSTQHPSELFVCIVGLERYPCETAARSVDIELSMNVGHTFILTVQRRSKGRVARERCALNGADIASYSNACKVVPVLTHLTCLSEDDPCPAQDMGWARIEPNHATRKGKRGDDGSYIEIRYEMWESNPAIQAWEPARWSSYVELDGVEVLDSRRNFTLWWSRPPIYLNPSTGLHEILPQFNNGALSARHQNPVQLSVYNLMPGLSGSISAVLRYWAITECAHRPRTACSRHSIAHTGRI